MSNQNDFENIKAQTDFVQFLQMVTGKQVQKSGSNLRMNPCPNCGHKDCFTIYPNTKSFSCFSCGWGGDMFTLIQKVHNLTDKREVLKKAAELTNIGLGERQTEATGKQDTQNPTKKIFSQSAAFFEDLLLKDKAALKILKETRHYDVKTVKEFHLGYTGAPGTDRQKLYSYLRGLDYSDADLLASGLIVKRKKIEDYFLPGLFVFPHFIGNQPHDFTIKDALKHTKKDKSKVIDYRLKTEFRTHNDIYFWNQSALNQDEIIITEGQHDAIQLIRSTGNKNVMAITGNPSKIAMEFLQKAAVGKLFYLAFDMDEAGHKYRNQFFIALYPFANKIKVIEWDSKKGKDLDDYLKLSKKG